MEKKIIRHKKNLRKLTFHSCTNLSEKWLFNQNNNSVPIIQTILSQWKSNKCLNCKKFLSLSLLCYLKDPYPNCISIFARQTQIQRKGNGQYRTLMNPNQKSNYTSLNIFFWKGNTKTYISICGTRPSILSVYLDISKLLISLYPTIMVLNWLCKGRIYFCIYSNMWALNIKSADWSFWRCSQYFDLEDFL